MDINTFLYYLNEYMKEINAGGTFTYSELFEQFKRLESNERVNKLIDESKLIANELALEDWEKDTTILGIQNKYGKKHLDKVIQSLIVRSR